MLHGRWRSEQATNMYVKESLEYRLQLTKNSFPRSRLFSLSPYCFTTLAVSSFLRAVLYDKRICSRTNYLQDSFNKQLYANRTEQK